MDFTSSYQINEHLKIYFNAKNLLNTPLRYFEGASDRPIQREFYDVTLEGGATIKF
jgi:outer membrane receptor protein involved in Fe transport